MGCGIVNVKDEDKDKIYGLFGFKNINGECFINSVLQIFTHLNIFNSKINNYINKNDKNFKEKVLLAEYKNILTLINKKIKIISSLNIRKAMSIINEQYMNSNELDANDFITDFIIEMNEELSIERTNKLKIPENEIEQNAFKKLIKKYYKNESFIMDMFFGIKKIEKLCASNHIIDAQFENFILLELNIYPFIKKESINVKEILDLNFKDISCISKCNECQKESESIQKIKLYSLPEILIIYFGRNIDGKFYDNKITFDEIIDMNLYAISKEKYSLFGIIQNINGHYSSCTINNYDEKWYFFNDSEEPKKLKNNEIFLFNPIFLFYLKIK